MSTVHVLLVVIALVLWRVLLLLDRIATHYSLVDTIPNGASPAWSLSELYALLRQIAQAHRLHEQTWLKDKRAMDRAKGRGDSTSARGALARSIVRDEWPKYLQGRFASRLQDNVAVSRGDATVVQVRERDAESERRWHSEINENIIPAAERLHRIEEIEGPIAGLSEPV